MTDDNGNGNDNDNKNVVGGDPPGFVSQKIPPDVPMVLEEEDDQIPLVSGARRLFTSSKGLIVGFGVVGVIVMNVLGKIDGPTALNAVLVLVGMYVGGVALEDGAEKLRVTRGGANPNVVMKALAILAEKLGPMLTSSPSPPGVRENFQQRVGAPPPKKH